MIFNKPLKEINEEDLLSLIGILESQELEFKQEPFARNDEGTRELLRDTTAFANATGGYIVIGMEADHESRASQLRGFENAEEEVQRIIDSYLKNISERILGIDAKAIPLAAGGSAIVVYIPRSTTAPHLVTFRGLNQFGGDMEQ